MNGNRWTYGSRDDRANFNSIHDLAKDVKLHGYYGGIRLIKATIKRFVDYCEAQPVDASRTATFPSATKPMSRDRWGWPVPVP